MSYNSENYFNSKEFKAVLKRFEESEKNGSLILLDSEELSDVAEYYYNNGDAGYADDILDRAISLYPGAPIPLLFKARIALSENNNIKKAEYYVELIEDKTDVEYYYIQAEIMIAKGNTEEADAYLESKLSDIYGEDENYFAIDVAAIFADYYIADKAEKWIKRSENKDSIDFKEQYAKIMMEKGDYEESKKLFNELIDKDPYSTVYWNSLASSQFFSNNIEESISSSEYSIAINPNNAAALLNKANGLYNLGNYKEALKFYLRYNDLCPDEENGEMMIGFCYLLLDDFEKAIERFEKAEKMLAPDSPLLVDLYKDWAFALCRLNRIDEGLAIIDRTDKLDCDHNEMLVYRGSLLIGSDRFEESKQYFIKAFAESGHSPNIFLKIALFVFEAGYIKVAYRMFKLAAKEHEARNSIYPYLAVCCYELKKEEEFLHYLKKAVEYASKETKAILSKYFPEEMDVKDYYNYFYQKISNKKNS